MWMFIFNILTGMDNEDVDTAAAIRNIEMEGEAPAMGQAGPINTTDMYAFDMEKPGLYHSLYSLNQCIHIWV